MSSSIVSLNPRVNRRYLMADSASEIFLAVDVEGKASPTTGASVAELALAIDRSGSMAKQGKMEHAKDAAIHLLESLEDRDHLTLITFAGKVTTELSRGSKEDVAKLAQAVTKLSADGWTDLYGAVVRGLAELTKDGIDASEGVVRRIVLITDGLPTKGKSKVSDFVKLAERVGEAGISVTALGIGGDYNEEILSALAFSSGGVWRHIRHPSEIRGMFARELESMKTTILVRPELRLELMAGAELSEAYKVTPMLNKLEDLPMTDGSYVVSLGDVARGGMESLVFRLHLPPRSGGEFRIAKVALLNGGTSVDEDVVVRYTVDPTLCEEETDPYPRMLLAASQGTVLLRSSVSTGDETLLNRATEVLKTALDDSEAETVVMDNALLRDTVAVFNEAYQTTVVNRKTLSAEDKKILKAKTTVIARE